MGSRLWLKRGGAGLAVAVGGATALYMLPGKSKENAATKAGRTRPTAPLPTRADQLASLYGNNRTPAHSFPAQNDKIVIPESF